jgi:hypothetical protein
MSMMPIGLVMDRMVLIDLDNPMPRIASFSFTPNVTFARVKRRLSTVMNADCG